MGNITIRLRFLLISILISVIPTLMLGTVSFISARDMLSNQAMASLVSKTEQNKEMIDTLFNRVEASLRGIAFSTSITTTINMEYGSVVVLKETVDEVINPLISLTVNSNDDYKNMTIYTSNDLPGYNAMLQPIENIYTMDNRISPALGSYEVYWSFSKNDVFASLMFLNLINKNLQSVISLELDADSIYQRLILPEYNICVYNKEGDILFKNDDDMPIDDSSPFESISRGGGYLKLNGKNNMAIRGESDNGEIVFYYYAPVENLVIDSDNILTTTMLFAMSMCMVVVILSFWFSSKLSKPLKKLVDTFNVVESGNFDIKLENNNRDEIGDLTRKFMHMLNRLKTAIEENNEAHKNAKEAELRALQAQINPHFLYNTLSIINWRAIEFGADELSDIVLTLSTFYRTALNRGSDEITLGEEIVNVKAYTDIRLSMSNNGFDVEYDIDETLLQCRVIKLILQPIVENALDHGIKELSTGRGKIIIRASKNGNELLLEVSDNGEGMSRELADDIISGTAKGYGLKNVNDRLKVKFGNQCGLRIESKKGLGTTVYIEGIRIE